MVSLKQTAENFEPNDILNISDLKRVPVDCDVLETQKTNKEGEDYTIEYIEVDEKKYRIPYTIKEQLKEHLEKRPNLKFFCASKKGEGKNTKYTLIPLDDKE